MATNPRLNAEPRDVSGKGATRKMRAGGRIPAVVYGHGEATRLLSVDAHELEQLFSRVHWENTIIELKIKGERTPVRTLVREVQAHAYKPNVLHVDFQQIHAGERLYVSVPIRLVGNAPGVKEGGVLTQPESDLEIRTTPDRIPEYIEVDISGLGIGDAVHLRDIALPEGVETETDPDRTICSVAPPTVAPVTEAEAAAAEAEPGAEPEVIRRAKEEGEE